LLAERGVEVDHVTIHRWVQRFVPLLAKAARPRRHAVGQRWLVEETGVQVAGRWRDVDRAVDQAGQVIDVFVATARRQGGPSVRRPGHRHHQGDTGCGGHRSSSDLPDGAGGVAASGLAPNRAVRQQSSRV
jgi:hypothetical protein